MSDYHDPIQYLLLEISGQVFAIPMAEVMAIRQWSGQNVPAPDEVSTGEITIPIIDLPRLFFAASQLDVGRLAYVIVISIPAFTCAVLVDGVRPARRVDPTDLLAMPPLLAGNRYLFKGIIREGDDLILIIDSYRLAEGLHQASPDLLAEKPHGS